MLIYSHTHWLNKPPPPTKQRKNTTANRNKCERPKLTPEQIRERRRNYYAAHKLDIKIKRIRKELNYAD